MLRHSENWDGLWWAQLKYIRGMHRQRIAATVKFFHSSFIGSMFHIPKYLEDVYKITKFNLYMTLGR